MDRAGLDLRSWIVALRRSVLAIILGLIALIGAWATLRVLFTPLDYFLAAEFYNIGANRLIAITCYVVATIGDNVWAPLVFLLYVFRGNRRDWTTVIVLAVAIAITVASTESLKMLFNLPRPYEVVPGIQARFYTPNNAGYPSGHTSRAFTAATVVALRYSRLFGILFVLLGVGTGLSMIILGLHFPSDIIGGAAIGVMSGVYVSNLAKSRSESHVTQQTS